MVHLAYALDRLTWAARNPEQPTDRDHPQVPTENGERPFSAVGELARRALHERGELSEDLAQQRVGRLLKHTLLIRSRPAPWQDVLEG